MSYAILGGGISGLSTAYYLSKHLNSKISIYESSNHLGGWIKSVKTKNGTLFELGPRSLRHGEASLNTLELVEELGLVSSVEPVTLSNKAARNHMIYFNNQIVTIPTGILSLFRIKPPFIRPIIHAIMQDIRTPLKKVDDEPVHNFISRRFGEDYAENIFAPIICGIFAGDAKEISVKAVLKNLFEAEQKHGGIIRGLLKVSKKKKKQTKVSMKTNKWSAWSFRNGLETLPLSIQDCLMERDNVEVFLENKCSSVTFEKELALITVNGKVEIVNHLYASLPSKDLAKILGNEHSFLKTQLSSIPFVSVAVVNFGYSGDLIKQKGFGILVPPNQNLPILGICYDSCLFPQEGKTVLSVMMGGRWFEHHFGSNPDEGMLLKVAEDHVKKILNIDTKPTDCMVTILKDCIPQYVVGHSKTVDSIRDYIARNKLPLTLIGNSYDGVGIHDAILSARRGAEKLFL